MVTVRLTRKTVKESHTLPVLIMVVRGNTEHDWVNAPGGTWKMIEAKGHHTCAMDFNNQIDCWGKSAEHDWILIGIEQWNNNWASNLYLTLKFL